MRLAIIAAAMMAIVTTGCATLRPTIAVCFETSLREPKDFALDKTSIKIEYRLEGLPPGAAKTPTKK